MEELIKRALQGDKNSYINLITSIQTDMYRTATARLHDLDDINDAIQETILKSYKQLHSLKDFSYFKTWIIRILINECNQIYRRKQKQLGIFNKISNNDAAPSSLQELQDVENDIDFDILINKLNYNERIILTLYYKNTYSILEISDILNISNNTVKSRLFRAKQKLKKLYEEGGLKYEAKK